MKVLTFKGSTLGQAMQRAKARCGVDATILHQQEFPAWQWWRPRCLVTVGVEDTAPPSSPGFPALIPSTLTRNGSGVPDPVAPASEGGLSTVPSVRTVTLAPDPVAPGGGLSVADRALLQHTLRDLQTWREQERSAQAVSHFTWPTPWTPLTIPTEGDQRIACIGPTGAGKTTTIGKLAAISALQDHHPTHLLTADTFRAGATAQIQQFARVLQIPCQVVTAGQEWSVPPPTPGMHRRWFLDTPGVTAQESYRLAEIQAWLQAFQPTLTYVVLPATLDPKRFAAIAALFGTLTEHPALLLTKVDEVDTLEPIGAAMEDLPWPWSYLGTGQTVPNDLIVASQDAVVAWTAPVAQGAWGS